MAFDLSGLSAWVDENSFELISKTILQTDLASYTNVRVGLKGDTVKIPLLSGDFTTQDGAACGFNASGDTDITQVTMELANRKFNQVYCAQTLRDYFLSQSLAAGAMAGGESLPFEALMADYYVKQLTKYNENFLISGEGAIDGYKAKIQVANGAVIQPGVPAAWDTSNAIAQSQALANAIPDAVADREDLIMVVSPAALRTLRLAITQANYYHIAPSEDVYVPGTSVKVVASSGLVGDDYKFAGPAGYLIMGTDLTSDFEQFKLFYSNDNDEIRAIMRWRVGVAVTEVNMFAENGL
jgi:hypothetical protein